MRVDRSLTFDMYFKDPACASKKPGPGNPCGDNIHEPRTDRGLWQLQNPAHDQRSVAHDLCTNRVLISRHFYYFGGQGPRIPADVADVVLTTQGQVREYEDLKHTRAVKAVATDPEWHERYACSKTDFIDRVIALALDQGQCLTLSDE